MVAVVKSFMIQTHGKIIKVAKITKSVKNFIASSIKINDRLRPDIKTFSTSFCVMKLGITTFSIMTLSITTFCTTLGKLTFRLDKMMS